MHGAPIFPIGYFWNLRNFARNESSWNSVCTSNRGAHSSDRRGSDQRGHL